MGAMTFSDTPLGGLILVQTEPVRDDRGEFVRTFCADEYASIRPGLRWVQTNISKTTGRGAVRGMHFQYAPAGEAKLIRCLRGEVFDVAVDVRVGSPTFLHWYGTYLSQDNQRELFLPEGFAHGFQVITDEAQLLYMHTTPWTPTLEGRIHPEDSRIDIAWPLPVAHLSDKDRSAKRLTDAFQGFLP